MEIRYVGKSVTGLCRPRAHTEPKRLTADRTYKGNWLRSLSKIGFKPEIVVLQYITSKPELSDAERWWIAIGKAALGRRFTNLTDGGEGVLGYKKSEEAIEKFTKAIRASWQRDDVRDKHSKAMLEVWQRPEYREPALAKLLVATRTPEARARHSEVAREAWSTPELRAQRIAAIKGGQSHEVIVAAALEVAARPDVRAKKSVCARARWADPAFKVAVGKKISLAKNTPEARAKNSEKARRWWADPANKELMREKVRFVWQRRKASNTEAASRPAG